MASDDVIELGSSDEETEPAPKRRKPPPNAMVHIPGKLPSGPTATSSKTTKPKINPVNLIKRSLGQAVTVTKITRTNANPVKTDIHSRNINPLANKKKLNGTPIISPIVAKSTAGVKQYNHIPVLKHTNVQNLGLSIVNNLHKVINPLGKNVQKTIGRNVPNQVHNLNMVKMVKIVPGSMTALKKTTLKSNLPPDITIKRTTPPKPLATLKINPTNPNTPRTLVHMSNTNKVGQVRSIGGRFKPQQRTEVPTVNLDDDSPATSAAAGPQWYLRPEDPDVAADKTEDDVQDPLGDVPSQDETDNNIEIEIPAENPQKSSPEKSPPATEQSTIEKQNNAEPDKSTYIEITIDDSPIKPAKHKKGFKVGAELPIMIEDSPVKSITDKAGPSTSDDENDVTKDRNSRKKLEYPKTVETLQVVEIEFEPVPEKHHTIEEISESVKETEGNQKSLTPSKESASASYTDPCNSENKKEKPKQVIECIDIVEIEESPVKPMEVIKASTPKKSKPTKPAYKMTEMETIVLDDKEKDEFSPMYQNFINLCFKLENSEDMKKIVEKKIKAYYRQVPKEYAESESFTDLVAGKIMAMKAGPEKMYLYIKDVVDELNLQRKLVKAQPAKEKEEQQKFLYGEDSEFNAKRQRQIRKLEKTLKKLHRAIQKLEEQEVDFDDEEDSVYLLTESEDDTSPKDDAPLSKEVLLQRYKERSVRVHAKLCQLTNTKMPSEARVQIDPRPGQPKGPAKRIEKWINRKVPIGTPLPFPDFHDVLRCVREANQEDKLGWNEADIMEEARDLFMRCGKKLQRRRQENEWRLAASRIPMDTVDPAEDSTDLKKKLEENRRVAAKRETEVFNKFADRQNQLKLEAVEIGDKEAEESPVESDDEELVEVTDSLTNKEKRKERLKRLLKEKSKVSDNKPESLSIDSENSQKDDTKYLKADEGVNDSEKDARIKDLEAPEHSAKDNEENDRAKGLEAAEHSSKDNEGDTQTKYSKAAEGGTKDTEEQAKRETDTSDKEPQKSNLPKKDKNNDAESDSSCKSKGNNVESDIDELHLLEKLYSENEYDNVGSSDTGSLIAISDSSSLNDKMSSDERRSKKPSSDVISIENSSYSESEEKKGDSSKETETENVETNKVMVETVDIDSKLEGSVSDGEKSSYKSSKKELNGFLEAILLASSDEADDTESRKDNPISETCINLRDDNISIGETLIVENRDIDTGSETSKADKSDKNTITDGSSVEGMEIGPIEINSEDQNKLDSIVEIASIESLEEGNAIEVSSPKSPGVNKDRSTVETNINFVETIEDDSLNGDNINKATNIESKQDLIDEIVKTKTGPIHNMNNASEKFNVVEDKSTTQSTEDITMNEAIQDVKNAEESNVTDNNSSNNEQIINNDSEIKEDNIIYSKKDDVSMEKIQDIIQNEKMDEVNETLEKEMIHNNNAMEVDMVDETL